MELGLEKRMEAAADRFRELGRIIMVGLRSQHKGQTQGVCSWGVVSAVVWM